MKCWICQNNEANSGEHNIKKTDLKIIFPNASQKAPINHSRDGENKRPIGSIAASEFKYSKVICEECNNNKTQKHDTSWEELSKYFNENWTTIKNNGGFYLNNVFQKEYKIKIVYVQLFFVKIFGCKIAESKIRISLNSLSNAINQDREHPDVYISFRESDNCNTSIKAKNSDIQVYKDKNEKILYAHWFYTIGKFTVDLIYSENTTNIELNGAKNPSSMNDYVSLSKLNYDQNYRKI